MRPVYYFLDDMLIIRQRPEHIRISESKLLKSNKDKFNKCIDFYKKIKNTEIRKIWDEKAKETKAKIATPLNRTKRQSGYNLFMKHNLQLFNENALFVDQDKLVISIGSLPIAQGFMTERDPENPEVIKVSFKDNSGIRPNSKSDSLCIVAAIENYIYFFNLSEITRESGGGTFHFPDAADKKTRLWAYFQSEKGKGFSVSVTACLV